VRGQRPAPARADAGPLGGAAGPAGERDEKVARAPPRVGIGRRQQAAAGHDDQAIVHPARRDDRRAAAARQGLVLVADLQGIIATGGECGEARVVQRRMGQWRRVEQLRPARSRSPSDGDAGALRREPLVDDPAVECSRVFGVREHHDAVTAHPLVENREIADRERVGQTLRLAATEDEHGAIAGEILPGEMRIEAAILHAVARRMPGRGGGFERQRIGECQVNDEKAMRLRLARCNEQQQEEV